MLAPIETPQTPAPVGHYAQGLRVGNLLFTSGQLPMDPTTQTFVSGDIGVLARRVLDNLAAVVRAGGSTKEHILRVNVYLTDPLHAVKVNTAFAAFFGPEHKPTRTTVVVAQLPLGAALEMDAIAWVPGPSGTNSMPLDS